MTRVLFVCVKNGGKSQMAAGLFRDLVRHDTEPGRWEVGSAGTRVGTSLNALSVTSLAEVDGAGIGQEAGRVGLELLDEDALGGDLAERLTVG